MRNAKLGFGVVLVICCSVFASGQMAAPPPAKTSGDALNAILSIAEGEFTGAADAMPEDKFSFAPTGSGEFKGVRTFAQQVKHVAAVNYVFGSTVLQEKPPVETGGESGPDTIKSKAEIMKYLSDSFVYLHKALASVTDKNQLDEVSVFGMKAARLSVGAFSIAHPMDHYGQMVEYLRMNSIIPPASRPQNK